MKESRETRFLSVFNLARSNYAQFKTRITKKDLSQVEKKLLTAYLLYTKKNKTECLDLLKSTSTDSNYFFEGVRLYFIGLALNHFGTYRFAMEHLLQSVSTLEQVGNRDFIINPLALIIVTLANQKKRKELLIYNAILENQQPYDDYTTIMKYHAQSVAYLELGELQRAEQLALSGLEGKKKASKYFGSGFLLVLFSIYIKQKKFSKCWLILDQYKASRGFMVKENYKYMKILLGFISKSAPLYVYANDFKEIPELLDQLEVIKFLSVGNIKGAEDSWKRLSMNNKSLYKKNFTYNGEVSLFSLSLDKLMNDKKLSFELSDVETDGKKPIEIIHEVIVIHNVTISKNDLVSLIWGEDPDEKNLARLRKIISRYNSKRGEREIISFQDTYKKAS